jgi:hypothetical protein
VIVSAILFAGCQFAMNTSPSTPDATNPTNRAPVEWPLRFKRHNFGARCYDTLECKVLYDNFDHGADKPTPSSAERGPDYLKGWNGSYGGIDNFPDPAKVIWRSKDGVPHESEIDIGEIFKDELIRHHVPREEMANLPDGKYDDDPSVLLEVNDRTIRVYMSAFVSTKREQIPGNKYSNFRDDVILVETYTY